MLFRACVCAAFFVALSPAQNPFERATEYGPGVTPPRLLQKIDPTYTQEALNNRVQGSVVLEIAVDEQGAVAAVDILSPLGYGLDEQAVSTARTWKFAPATKDGKPVLTIAHVAVHFRFGPEQLDEKAEARRISFNEALQTVHRATSTPKMVQHAVETMQWLAREEFPPGLYMVGYWKTTGQYLASDPEEGLALIRKAAAKGYGPALYEVAIRQIEGRDGAKDPQAGLDQMRHAAELGAPKAQAYLGELYSVGALVPREPSRARRYFRMCAARSVAACQFRLGTLLFDDPAASERDRLQAVAWLRLAADNGAPGALEAAEKRGAGLGRGQVKKVEALMVQLRRK